MTKSLITHIWVVILKKKKKLGSDVSTALHIKSETVENVYPDSFQKQIKLEFKKSKFKFNFLNGLGYTFSIVAVFNV